MQSMSAEGEDRAYCFGDYRLVPGRQLLLFGDKPVRLGARALDLLLLLVEHPGELVSKAQLIRFAWPGTFVHEGNLKVNIAALRRALRQDDTQAPFIATIPGRGYRFVATVRLERADQAPDVRGAARGGVDRLPGPATVIGRDEVVAELTGRLRATGFLTIVGPAGVGKTTVAAAVARKAAVQYRDGVRFVDLAAIGDPQLVTAAVASAIGAGGEVKDTLGGIVDSLRGRRSLLILDNCEHVLQAACLVAEHIRTALPDIDLLATSREPLRSRAEAMLRLPPLPCPEPGAEIDAAEALAFPAVALFVARAAEATGFRLQDGDASIVADICRRLDGIPLAIELAAPRLRSSDPATLLRLLTRSLELLRHGPAHAPIRQQALLAALDWSYRLLSPDEATVLRLLSVFAGSFTLEEVIEVGRHLERPAEDLAGFVEGLSGKSLLSSQMGEAGLQYRLLETTRDYADERLRAAGEQRRAAVGHAQYLLRLFERAEAEWHWRVREDWTATFGRRANDLRKAIDWAFGEDGDPQLGVRLTAAGIPLWDELSATGESRSRFRRALQSDAVALCDPSVRMKLTTAYAWSLAFAESIEPEAEAAWIESLRLAEATGDADYRLRALWGLASLRSFAGRHRQALESLDRLLELAGREKDESAVAAGARIRLMTAFYAGEVRGVQEMLQRHARQYDRPDRRSRVSRFQMDHYVGIRVSLATASWVAGDHHGAAATAQAALDGATALGHVVSQANALAQAVIPVALWNGRVDEAERHLPLLVGSLNRRHLDIWGPFSRFFAGAIQHEGGDGDGIDAMRDALREAEACGILIRLPMYLSMLADMAMALRRMDVARASVDAARRLVARGEELWCRPEVLRVQGLLACHDGDAVDAERLLRRAAALAARSGSRSFELRAALGLACCLARGGRAAAGAEVLAPVMRRFDGAPGSRDVVRGRQLFERLGASPAGQASSVA